MSIALLFSLLLSAQAEPPSADTLRVVVQVQSSCSVRTDARGTEVRASRGERPRVSRPTRGEGAHRGHRTVHVDF